jgi:hypothetical protein
MRSITTINEEKDKKGLLRPLTYKEKYLMYYNMGPQTVKKLQSRGNISSEKVIVE